MANPIWNHPKPMVFILLFVVAVCSGCELNPSNTSEPTSSGQPGGYRFGAGKKLVGRQVTGGAAYRTTRYKEGPQGKDKVKVVSVAASDRSVAPAPLAM